MLAMVPVAADAEIDSSAPHVFGFFQTSFHHYWQEGPDENSFNLQQLNVFISKSLTPRWRAFINFEYTNTFSTERNWGDFSIEEAWLGYSPTQKIHLKIGLLIPIFNNLNEIKNKTPLLPYVTRPIVYESSFADRVAAESFIPRRAFMQVYGFLGIPESKLDYAFYVGNSPNVKANQEVSGPQSGVDSTASFLVGGRLGIRHGEFKAGVSGTYDHTNEIVAAAEFLKLKPDQLDNVHRYRIGADLSHRWKRFSLEAEHISSHYDITSLVYNLDRHFTYFTLGYHATDRLFLYGGYWWTRFDGFGVKERQGAIGTFDLFDEQLKLTIPGGGFSYSLNDQITLKAQYGYGDQRVVSSLYKEQDYFHFINAAISAMF